MPQRRCDRCGRLPQKELCIRCFNDHVLPWDPAWEPLVLGTFETTDDVTKKAATEGCKVYVNATYQVLVRDNGTGAFGPMLHLSIKRRDQKPIRDWRDFQRIKNELAGPDAEAVELFPAESRLVDTANQYHLWVFKEFTFPFGFSSGRVLLDAHEGGDSKQRPFADPPPDVLSKEEVDRRVQEKYGGKEAP